MPESPQQNTEMASVRKRRRPTIVCLRCRSKKSKCDKALPCSNCVKAKCPEQCHYEHQPISAPIAPMTAPMAVPMPVPMASPLAVPVVSQPQPGFESSWIESIKQHLRSSNVANLADSLAASTSGASVNSPIPAPQVILESNNLLIGVNPVVQSTDMINFHMDLSAIPPKGTAPTHTDSDFQRMRYSNRSISLVEVSQQEPGAKLFWKFDERVEKMKLMTLDNFPDHKLRSEVLAEARSMFKDSFIDLYPHALKNIGSNEEVKKVFSKYGLCVGLSLTENFEFTEESAYSSALKTILPLRDALFGYVRQFFQKIYPLYPVVDEDWLTERIDHLLEYSGSGTDLLEVHITGREDLLFFAILLFILRLSFLSFFTNSLARNAAILNVPQVWGLLLAQSQITISAVDLATRLINSGCFRRRALFLSLQAHILATVTRIHALENELSLNALDTEINVGQLLQMAMALTMDRDPDFVRENSPMDAKTKNLRRKVWYVLVQLDYTMAYTFFCPRGIATSQYSTKLPTYSIEGSNINDHELEESCIRKVKEIHEVLLSGSDLLDTCLDMNKSHRVVDVICKLNDLEMFVSDRLGWTQNYFKENGPHAISTSILTVLQLRTQVMLKLFMAHIYYFLHLYYTYKKDQELEFFFFRKLLLIVYTEMNYFCAELMFTRDLMADPTFNLFMTPVILIYLHVVAMVGLGFAIRLHCTVFVLERMGDNNSTFRVLKDMISRNETFIIRKLKLCKLLSERYFFGWKCTKANGIGYRMVYGNQIYSADLDALTRAKISWSERQQLEMLNLIPDDVPIQMSDVGDVRLHCYYSNRSLDDSELRGPDLSKTIQTDNFWIFFNALHDRDPYAAAFSKDNGGRKQTNGPSERTNAEVAKARHDATNVGPSGAPTNDLPAPSVPNGPAGGNDNFGLIIPTASDYLDFNFFSTDWTIDEFYPSMNQYHN